MRRVALGLATAALSGVFGAAAQPRAGEAAATVAETLASLRAQPEAQFRTERGWTVVASRERDDAVEWFFTPEGHPAHPAVIKRAAVERDGVGMIDLEALCHAPQAVCDRLLDEFRQRQRAAAGAERVPQVQLDVGIAIDDRERVTVRHMVAENGKAAEIRMDDVFKMVIVPTLGERGVLLWAALYEFDGSDYALLATPQLSGPVDGTATVEIEAASGDKFGVTITPLVADRAE